MNRLLYLLPVVVLIGIGALFYVGLKNGDSNGIPSTLIGNEAPALPDTALEGYDAGDFDAILAQNGIIMVNYFASWCGPCRAEHPNLIALKDRGIAIIGINYKDQPENAKRFIEELGNPYVAIRTDENARAAIDWGVSGVPETFFVDGDGIVVKRHFGPITSQTMENEILPFIEGY